MYLNDKATFLGGLAMVLLAVTTVIVVLLTAASMGENDPFKRDEVAQFLTDVHDNQTQIYIGAALGIISDGFIALVAAVMVFVLFRDRSFMLATAALVGIIAAAAISLTNDIITIMATIVAGDFVEGGAAGIPSGDPAILELGRLLGMMTPALGLAATTAFGLTLISLGWLLARAPAGAVNPPRWLGWIAIVAGLACWLSWLVVASEAFFIFFPINLIATLVFLLGTGGWLIAHRSHQPEVMATAASPA
jgi:hypothetical protein